MADQKLSALTELGAAPATTDLLYLDHSGTSNSLTVAHLFTSPSLITPALGTPASGTLTNATGLPAAGVVNTAATLSANQTLTGQNKFNNIIDVNNAVTVSSNAGTVPVTFRLNTFTNSSAANMTITMALTSAVAGQMTIVRILDASGVAKSITWVNTENSTVSAPTTSNGSTTLPLTVGFMYNENTTLWRCIAIA